MIATVVDICNDLSLLYPAVIPQFERLRDMLAEDYATGKTRTRFVPFEGYRTPQRQRGLGQAVTKAGPFRSAHQYGLAVDFVPYNDGRWSWDPSHDWPHLALKAVTCGLVRPYTWDLPHIVHPLWWEVRHALESRVHEPIGRGGALQGGAPF